eukprot:2275117-Amphidinium_carterae.1
MVPHVSKVSMLCVDSKGRKSVCILCTDCVNTVPRSLRSEVILSQGLISEGETLVGRIGVRTSVLGWNLLVSTSIWAEWF